MFGGDRMLKPKWFCHPCESGYVVTAISGGLIHTYAFPHDPLRNKTMLMCAISMISMDIEDDKS